MTYEDWQKLRDWLFAVFPEADAREMLGEEVVEAQGLDMDVPASILAEVAR